MVNSPGCTSPALGLGPRFRRKMLLRSALLNPTAKSRPDPRQPSHGFPTENMLTAIGLCGELFHSAAGTALRHPGQWPPRNLAHTQQAVAQLAAPLPLPSARGGASAAANRQPSTADRLGAPRRLGPIGPPWGKRPV